jgi:hypothetical protein
MPENAHALRRTAAQHGPGGLSARPGRRPSCIQPSTTSVAFPGFGLPPGSVNSLQPQTWTKEDGR